MNQRISTIAKELILNDIRFCHMETVSYGDLDLLHEIFERSEMSLKNSHPINKCKAVLNSLDRESKFCEAIFEKKYFKANKGLARMFVLKNNNISIP